MNRTEAIKLILSINIHEATGAGAFAFQKTLKTLGVNGEVMVRGRANMLFTHVEGFGDVNARTDLDALAAFIEGRIVLRELSEAAKAQ